MAENCEDNNLYLFYVWDALVNKQIRKMEIIPMAFFSPGGKRVVE
jgi:hypothetical protein